MIYRYDCKCGHTFDVVKKVDARNSPEICIGCNQMARRKPLPDKVQVCAVAASDWNGEYHSTALNKKVRSRSEERRLAKERGLTEVGTEDPKKTAKEYKQARDKKANIDISEITNLGSVSSKG